MWTTLKSMLKSRKFWGAAFGCAAFVGGKLGLEFSGPEAFAAASPFISYVLGVAWEDSAAKGAGKLPAAP